MWRHRASIEYDALRLIKQMLSNTTCSIFAFSGHLTRSNEIIKLQSDRGSALYINLDRLSNQHGMLV